MKFSRTFVFILLFAFAAAVYVYQTRLAKQFLTNVPDEVNRNVTLSQHDTIDHIALRDNVQKTQIELRKREGAWVLEVPVRYPAEGQIVEGLAVAARMASRQPRLKAEKEWEEYGLAAPDIEITFGLPEKRSAVLLIGAQAPVGKAIYARWDGERGYVLLPPEMKFVFRQSVYGLREKRIFRASPETFRKISVEMGEHSYQWKKDEADWYWFEPVAKFGQRVSSGGMDPVIAALKSLHVKEFRDNNKKSRAELGFFMIHDRIRIESEGGSLEPQGGKTENFHFGNEIPEYNAYYGFLEGEDTVFLVDREKVIRLFDLIKTLGADDGKETGSAKHKAQSTT